MTLHSSSSSLLAFCRYVQTAVLVLVFFLALTEPYTRGDGRVSQELFDSLEELARIVDITYCVGTTGIYKPFRCAGRCREFEGFELVKTWNTGPLLSDSCGYLALSHPPWPKRIIVAFRGTYSITNTIVDLSAIPQVYVPFPDPGGDDTNGECSNCTIHAGFLASWTSARTGILEPLADIIARYPDYQLVVVGHSLGGAVAAIAGLEFHVRGWNPQITTFGEPRIGNDKLAQYLDSQFHLPTDTELTSTDKPYSSSFRRVTHINDPVPLLPLSEWGYASHAGEIFISKPDLPPSFFDLRLCTGDEDPNCSAQGENRQRSLLSEALQPLSTTDYTLRVQGPEEEKEQIENHQDQFAMTLPTRYKLWELFFAHRDYFWRVGVCLPKPEDWIPGWDDPKPRWKWKWGWPGRGKTRCHD